MTRVQHIEWLSTLYKKTNTGAAQYWRIGFGRTPEDFGIVQTEYGQVGTDSPQTTTDVIKTGKNAGRANETTPWGQAQAEAVQKHTKKKKAGYVVSLDQAKSGDKGLPGIDPMLAHPWEKQGKSMPFPCFGQPKLDGLRAICVVENGKAQFYSRTRKPFKTVPHLVQQVEELCRAIGTESIIFDGELYAHHLKHDFNRITSLIKRDDVHPDISEISYHIYDLPGSDESFSGRQRDLQKYLTEYGDWKNLVLVETLHLKNREHLQAIFEKFVEMGYEGLMARDPGSYYEGKRSKGLLKFKEFQDAEFRIVGVQEGKGKLMGSAGSFICVTEKGKEFSAKLKGELESLKEYFSNFHKYKGQMLTVQFFNLTPDGVPRFPVGLRLRPDGD